MTCVLGTRSYAKQLLRPLCSSNRSEQFAKKAVYRSLNAWNDSVSCEWAPGPELNRRPGVYQQQQPRDKISTSTYQERLVGWRCWSWGRLVGPSHGRPYVRQRRTWRDGTDETRMYAALVLVL